MKERIRFDQEMELLTESNLSVDEEVRSMREAEVKRTAGEVLKDTPRFDITGRYYTPNPPVTYVINQAGLHFECIASSVLGRLNPWLGDLRPLAIIDGDLRSDGMFYWFNRTSPSKYGTLSVQSGRLFMKTSGGGKEFELLPMEKRPTLMGSAHEVMKANSGLDMNQIHELAPLTPGQTSHIRHLLDKSALDELFRIFFDLQKKKDAVATLQRRFVEWRNTKHPDYAPHTKFDRFHLVDMPLVRQYARRVLTIQKWTSNRNITRSHLDWIQIMQDLSVGQDAEWDLNLRKYLGVGVSPKDKRGEHTYEFEIRLTGASLVLGAFSGRVEIVKKSGKQWKKPFVGDIDLYGLNVALGGADVKIGHTFKGAAASYIEWTENDFPGSVRLARATASIGMDVASAHAGFMHVFGNESLPILEVFFWNADLGFPDIRKIAEEAAKGKLSPNADQLDPKVKLDPKTGQLDPKKPKLSVKGVFGPDVTAAVLFGSISQSGSLFEKMKKAGKLPHIDLSRDWKSDVSVARKMSSEVHFNLDSDQLTDAGRQALRIMCARELPSFLASESYLAVVGHADTLAKEKPGYNLKLSERRANNTIQAIRDILGAKFKIKEDANHIKPVPMGDLIAGQEYPGKPVAAPKHRRVQIFLNSVLVLTLFGQPKP